MARGASRVDPPQQQVVEQADGSFTLEFRPMSAAEQSNAALSLAANLAIADALYRHGTGLFRVMPEPDDWAIRRLRHSAKALGVEWPKTTSLEDRQRDLDPNDPKQAAFMLAIRRAGAHASYAPFRAGERPWHSAMRATYIHATAPLRRLADRYVTRSGAGGRQRARGAGRRHSRIRAFARRDESGGGESRTGRQRGPGTRRVRCPRRAGWRALRRDGHRSSTRNAGR